MLAILVLTLLAQALVVQGGCSVGWHLHNGMCYGFGTDHVTWADALTICQLYDATLAEPRNASVHYWLVNQLQSRGVEAAWVGGTDIFQEGIWVWASDKTAIGGYINWRRGQPNDFPPGQDCMELLGKFYSGWDDDRCAEVHYFICQKNESGTTASNAGSDDEPTYPPRPRLRGAY